MDPREFDELLCRITRQIDGCLNDFRRTAHGFLSALEEQGPVPMTSLAELLQISLPRCSALAKRMEEKGFVKRTSPKHDKRICLIAITDAGRAALTESKEKFHKIYALYQDYLGEKDFEELCRLIDKSSGFLDTIKEVRCDA